ncbi:MAG TPA: DUF4328 domain-containing protein [Pirellulales bacterium]|nr:DUF4328 domain-containing protein [Pirellulales bacterium]
MSSNPYESPSIPTPSRRADEGDATFVSGHGRAICTMVLLGLFAAASLILIGAYVLQAILLVQVKELGMPPPEGSAEEIIEVLAALVQSVLYLGCVVSFLVWLYRASRNVHALDPVGVQHSPGGAIGWWFVPIANFFKPYVVVTEIYRASKVSADYPGAWKSKPVPDFFGWWWACWLLGVYTTGIVVRLGRGVESLDGRIRLAWGSAAVTLLMVIAAILAILVVHSIDRRQQAGFEAYEGAE